MKYNTYSILFLLLILIASCSNSPKEYDATSFGIVPNTDTNISPLVKKMLAKIKSECSELDSVIICFASGKYNFHEDGAAEKTYYISNHDQPNPKKVAIAIEGFSNLVIDGQGSSFVYHGRLIPVSVINSTNCTLKNFSINCDQPHIAQVEIINNKPKKGITFKVAPWVNHRINQDGYFETFGEGWTMVQGAGVAFEKATRHMVYQTSDFAVNTKGVQKVADDTYFAPNWKNDKLVKSTIVAMRSWQRPTPGIFLYGNTDTYLRNIKVHYSEGMGLLAQVCNNITLDGFGVCLKGDDDPRYFTSQADATHFSGCKGKITSINGLYEGMMDDAINVHGTYLRIIKRLDDKTVVARYMHPQSYGFTWGEQGDTVQFITPNTMELFGERNTISSILPYKQKEVLGAKEFKIVFESNLDKAIVPETKFGIENLTWTPEVLFANNTIRNNRARGSLFSTPKRTIVENNTFDHTSGSAILLCGDCNGWFETGACRDVIIRNNKFINALTNYYQFTNAIISIYPEIPNLKSQKKYFHGGKNHGITIENNTFETFDAPILYAKSTDGIIFKNNTILKTTDYKPFHWNKHKFLFERVRNITIKDNSFPEPFNEEKDVKTHN